MAIRFKELWDASALHWVRTSVLVAIVGIVVSIVIAVAVSDHGDAPAADQLPEQSKSPDQALCGASSETDLPVGWGPERPIYTDTAFPGSLTFNSTYENPNLGDERNWVAVKPAADTEAGGWLDEVEVQPGQQYLVRAYIRLDGPADQAATNVTLKFIVPNCTAHRIGSMATLTSENTFPMKIWDGAEFWSRNDFNLTVIPDSAELESNRRAGTNALHLATYDLVSATGVNIVSDETTGEFLPGYSESVYVTFLVLATAA